MTILKFVTSDELDDLDDDPRIAFMELVNHAQRRLNEIITHLGQMDARVIARSNEIEYEFMNSIVAAAKQFEIDPIRNIQIPRSSSFSTSDSRQFHSDLDHCITQLTINNRIRSKKESVALPLQSKERIRSQLNGLRQCIEQADMTEAKREALLQRLDEFEKELEKRRLNITVIALFACTILGIPGSVWASVEVVQKLTTTIMQSVADAKVAEDEMRRLPPTAAPKAISPPRV